MAAIVELWSVEDQRRLEHFVSAVEAGSTFDAVLALNSGDLSGLNEAMEAAREKVELAADFSGVLGAASAIATLIDTTWGIELEPGDELLSECDLARCWERRKASPRTLAALWVYVAQRYGFRAHWLEMNVFHPIVFDDGEGELMVDSTSGALVSKADCRDIFQQVTEEPESFHAGMFDAPVTRDVLAEILELRILGAGETQDEVIGYRNMRFHAALHRDKPRIVFASALAAAKIGDHVFARETLKDLAAEAEGTSLEEPVRQALERIEMQFQYTN